VYFKGQDSLAGQIESGKANRTTLTGYFELNANGAVGADGVSLSDAKSWNSSSYTRCKVKKGYLHVMVTREKVGSFGSKRK
jgi:hypothetical protein